MKKLLVLLLCLPLMGFGQLTYVPDNWFEAYLENNGMGNGVQYDDSVFTASIDTVTYLDLSYGAGQAIGIFDLTGIEDFTDLIELRCNSNYLTSLDVSNNTALEILWCHNNNLASLDISNNDSLTYLNCKNNQLNTLDVSNNTDLAELWCHNNNLTSLDISNNTSLTYLNCGNNLLFSLDVSQNTSIYDLYCFDNKLTTLDVSQNTNLLSLRCENNYLFSLNIKNGNNTNMFIIPWDFNLTNNPQLYCINVDDSAWAATNWTVSNGNIDSTMFFSNNCTSANLSLCDSVIISFKQIDTTTTPNLIYFDVQVSGFGPSVGYPGFVLLDQLGDTIAYENFNTAGNVYTLMPNAIEIRFLDVIQNLSLPFNGFIHLVDGWFAGNPNTACIYPFYISGITSMPQQTINKKLLKITDILGRETEEKRNTPLFYIYNDGTVEKKMIIE